MSPEEKRKNRKELSEIAWKKYLARKNGTAPQTMEEKMDDPSDDRPVEWMEKEKDYQPNFLT